MLNNALSTFLLCFYLALNSVTVLMYALDKSAAIQQQRRTPERTLHVLALLGGWPGAWLAQKLWRHKSRKRRFLVVFWLTGLLHGMLVAAVVYWF